MKTIVHIGMHKTATTSIQQYLRANHDALAAQGFYVPSSLAGYTHISHFALNIHCLDQDRYSTMKEHILEKKGMAYLEELANVITKDIKTHYERAQSLKCDKVIWSNEGLFLLNSRQEYQKLASLFAPYSNSIEIVCCFRNVWAFRQSYLNELAKQSLDQSQDKDSYRYLGHDSWILDHRRKRKLLAQVFNCCTYFQYDPIDNVKRFLNVLGIPANDTKQWRLNTR